MAWQKKAVTVWATGQECADVGGWDSVEIALSLLLLLTANGAPIIACYLLRGRGSWRVDAGLVFFDYEPLLGEAKTWRGIAAAVMCCMVIALLLGYPAVLGVQFAVYAMLGDLISSFIKRRLHITVSDRATGLDQIPEALLPLVMLQHELALGPSEIAAAVIGFFFLELGLSRLLYHWHIRKRPY